jgi:hypothetical protein
MTENLRYIGSTSQDFHQGEVYTLLVSVQNEMYWLAEEGRQAYPYDSLADFSDTGSLLPRPGPHATPTDRH